MKTTDNVDFAPAVCRRTPHDLGADLWAGGRLLVSRAGSLVDANGEIGDAPTREAIGKFMKGFVDYVRLRKGG